MTAMLAAAFISLATAWLIPAGVAAVMAIAAWHDTRHESSRGIRYIVWGLYSVPVLIVALVYLAALCLQRSHS